MQIDEIAKAIREKYGKDAARILREDWSLDDEREYQLQVEILFEKEKKLDQTEKPNLFNGEDKCPCCGKLKIYFKIKDDVNILKFGCCNTCYINYVEDREERWHNGWRPKITKEETQIGK